MSECVKLWKDSLSDKTIADKIGDPTQADDEEDEEDEEGEGEEGEEEVEG